MSSSNHPRDTVDAEVTVAPAPEPPARGRGSSDRAIVLGDRIVLAIARHWLALFNLAVFVYVAVPFVAPALMHIGATGPARLIYAVYSPTCHQLPDRSYFLFGEQRVYSLSELEAANVLPGTSILERRRYIGDETVGWKVALCERDIAIYAAVLIGGLIFGVLRPRVPKLPFKIYVLFVIPIAVDGFSQLFGLRTSNWWLRTLTGALFGLATVWLAYPYVDESMEDIKYSIEHKLDR